MKQFSHKSKPRKGSGGDDLPLLKMTGRKGNNMARETYRDFRERMQKKFKAFPTGAASSEKQLAEEIQRHGVASKDNLIGIGGGMFIRKTDREAFKALMAEIDKDRATYYSDEDNWVDMFETELADHEYCITGDVEDAIEALGLTYKEVQDSERMWEALCQAVDNYMESVTR